MLKLDLPNQLLGVEVQGSYLETCKLLSSLLALVEDVQLRFFPYHKQHVIKLLHKFDGLLKDVKLGLENTS